MVQHKNSAKAQRSLVMVNPKLSLGFRVEGAVEMVQDLVGCNVDFCEAVQRACKVFHIVGSDVSALVAAAKHLR